MMKNGNGTVWTDENVRKAAQLWAEGMSAAVIGAHFGVSRNSILGMAHRRTDLFKPRSKRHAAVTVRTEKKAPVTMPPVEKAEKPAPPPRRESVAPAPAVSTGRYLFRGCALPDTTPVAFADLLPVQCAFPLVDYDDASGPDMPCCGQPVEGGTSWCAPHARLVYGSGTRGKQSAARTLAKLGSAA